MYALQLEIYPTGGLTFRRMPSSILHISTYPFLPPTTMSGWLRRLFLLSAGYYPETDVKKPDYFTMPPDYYILGAYPSLNRRYSHHLIHSTARQGIRAFNHNAFSRIVRYANLKEVYQLHTWEYLFVDQLTGYILHQDAAALEQFKTIQNYGCKLGKEGYAYLAKVSNIIELHRETKKAMPTVLTPACDLIGVPGDVFTFYRYQHKPSRQLLAGLSDPDPTPIAGFVPVQAGWPAEPIEIEYFTDGRLHLPASWVEVLHD